MRVKYKLFPYPILCEEIDDYKQNKFEVEPIVKQDINRIKFEFTITIEDLKLQDMIKCGEAEIVYHIECPKTLFRKIYKESTLSSELYIENKNLNGTVEACCFIVAKKNIDNYKNDNFNEDYGSNLFHLSKGNILAFYNLPRITITKDTEDLAKMSSIFSILKQDESKENVMEIDIEGDKIKIWLGPDEFSKYNHYANKYQSYFHAMLIFPSLIYALDMVGKYGTDAYDENRWFKALEKVLQTSQIELNKDTIEKEGSYKLAQKLLNLPINRAISSISDEEDE